MNLEAGRLYLVLFAAFLAGTVAGYLYGWWWCERFYREFVKKIRDWDL